MSFIENPLHWRVSRSGYSIKTGWSDDKRVIAAYPGVAAPLNETSFNAWLDNAELIVKLHNEYIDNEQL